MSKPWVFEHAYLNRVIDGDTIVVDVDMGFLVWMRNLYVRLARVDCPEIRGDEKQNGLIARAWVKDTLKPFKSRPFTLKSEKHGKYRWIAEIEYDGMNLSDEIVRQGHGFYTKYR